MTEYEKMIRLLDTSWPVRKEIVPCLVGPPGIGKTAAVMQHADAHGCGKVVKIVASRCVPSETVGMTMPDHENRSMDIYNSMQLSSLEDGDILFLDELLEADQYVLSTLLTVIESREMADGTPLPDIQIIAATNDTIPPEQLKGNIRQRFMFMRFKVDMAQTHEYILEKTGMDIDRELLGMMCENGTDYNFLTPRSLTKLCLWVDATKAENLSDVEQVINDIWSSIVGTKIVAARRRRDSSRLSPNEQARKAIHKLIDDGKIKVDSKEVSHEYFENCTFAEMLEVLQALPEWDEIAKALSEVELDDEEDEASPILF